MRIEVARINESDEVEGWLTEALELVEKLQPPDDLRRLTFQFAVQLLSTKVTGQALPAPMPMLGLPDLR